MSTPSSEKPKNDQNTTDSSDTVLYIIDGPGDTTIVPRPPNIPRGWPPEARRGPPKPSPTDPPPATSQQ